MIRTRNAEWSLNAAGPALGAFRQGIITGFQGLYLQTLN